MNDFIRKIKVETIQDDNEIYHKEKEHISSSGLKKLKKSPLHFKEELKKDDSEALKFGSAYHTLILEPDTFSDKYYLFDERAILDELIGEGAKSPRATNKYKDWFANEMRLASKKVMLSVEETETLKSMKDRLMSHFYCRNLLMNGEAELSHYAEIETYEEQNIKIKIRPDYMNIKKRICIDLKTTTDASINGFSKKAAEYDYHISAALYNDVLEQHYSQGFEWTFIFIAQEKYYPYAFNLFEASPQFINQGRYEYQQLLLLWDYCKRNDKWEGYQVFCENKYGINQLSLPSWAINEINFYVHTTPEKYKIKSIKQINK